MLISAQKVHEQAIDCKFTFITEYKARSRIKVASDAHLKYCIEYKITSPLF